MAWVDAGRCVLMSGVQRFSLSAEQQLQRIHNVGGSCDDLVAFDSGDKTDQFIAAAKSRAEAALNEPAPKLTALEKGMLESLRRGGRPVRHG